MLARAFDSHCHLDDPRFDVDREQLLSQAAAEGVDYWLIPGVSEAQWARAARVATGVEQGGWGRALLSVGYHPYALHQHPEPVDVAARLDVFRSTTGVAAIGETGLDTPLSKAGGPSLEVQSQWMTEHCQYALKYALPLVLHVVGAHGKALDVLSECLGRGTAGGNYEAGGVVHAFSGSVEVAHRYVALGFRLGIGSLLLRRGARRAAEVTEALPLSSLLIETDAPDMAAHGERNEPRAVMDVARRVAELRGLPLEHVVAETRHNAMALFCATAALPPRGGHPNQME